MTVRTIASPILDVEERFEGFENLMPFRVQNILLVSSLYDSFILREDGRLNELLIDESLETEPAPDSRHHARFQWRGGAGAGAIQSAVQPDRHQSRGGGHGCCATRSGSPPRGLDVPVVVLGYDYREIKNFVARNPVTDIERVFLWQGTARILIAIVKYVEDKRNVLHDTRAMGVPVLLVVEDNIRYYSSFLPVIYTELIKQSRRVIQEGINVAHKLVRMQARPKILLSSNFEEAAELVQEYREYISAWCRTWSFRWEGKLSPEAGFELARMVHSLYAGCAGGSADQPHGVPPARPGRRLFVSAQAFADIAERPAAHSDRSVRLWRFRFPHARSGRSGPCKRSERTGRAAANGACREPDVSMHSAITSRTG